MTHPHWLVTQSVTSYVNLQGLLLGVFLLFGHCCLVSTFLCKQYPVLLVAAPTMGDIPGRVSVPP